MISARIFIMIFSLIKYAYDSVLTYLADKQRKKPLPEEVADIYDEARYQTYLNYVADNRKMRNLFKGMNLIIDIFFIFSPIYAQIEKLCNQNVYMTTIVTYLCIWIVSIIPDTIFSYYNTFVIQERYEMNKKDHKEFIKDELLELIPSLIITVVLFCLAIYIGERLPQETDFGNADLKSSLTIFSVLLELTIVIVVGLKLISYLILRKQYVFTELEDGELKNKINELQSTSRKKVKKIYVYNESKKSTTKNAFLLKLFWHREFGIADNFMDENSTDELLAVLSHEIGHLKHKKNIFNFIIYFIYGAAAVLLGLALYYPEPVYQVNEWVRESFAIQTNNYYLFFIVYAKIVQLLFWGFNIFGAYVSKREEYEADREAVKNGYGEALINMFKRLSSDELVNVNPHPVIEALEYDHPGMYQRIKAIRKAQMEI